LAYRLFVLLRQRYRLGLEFLPVYPPFFVFRSHLFLLCLVYFPLIFVSTRWGKVQYCPWCGELIDDQFSEANSAAGSARENDIYCEECGRRIYERVGKGGYWIDEEAGVCSGPCERELCGRCAEWQDGVDGGECPECRAGGLPSTPTEKEAEKC
jgi:hypothetical protein